MDATAKIQPGGEQAIFDLYPLQRESVAYLRAAARGVPQDEAQVTGAVHRAAGILELALVSESVAVGALGTLGHVLLACHLACA